MADVIKCFTYVQSWDKYCTVTLCEAVSCLLHCENSIDIWDLFNFAISCLHIFPSIRGTPTSKLHYKQCLYLQYTTLQENNLRHFTFLVSNSMWQTDVCAQMHERASGTGGRLSEKAGVPGGVWLREGRLSGHLINNQSLKSSSTPWHIKSAV